MRGAQVSTEIPAGKPKISKGTLRLFIYQKGPTETKGRKREGTEGAQGKKKKKKGIKLQSKGAGEKRCLKNNKKERKPP